MVFHSLENDPEYANLQTEMVWMQQHLHTQRKRLAILIEKRNCRKRRRNKAFFAFY